MTHNHMSLRFVDSGQRVKWMSYGISGGRWSLRGGEEEAENLSAIDMLHDVVDSFAKQPSDERGNQRESAVGSQKCDSRGQVVGA